MMCLRLLFGLSMAALLSGCPAPGSTMNDGGSSAQLDPHADEDGDGILNGAELTGYAIQVNLTGLPGDATAVQVTSDPYLKDSDGDGLDDAQELQARTDPQSPDTDSDGLSDFDEVNRWQTSPTTVDTDGDATGTDHTGDPLFALFDGAELKLVNDTTPGVGATSPTQADTDGDGKGDYEEFIDGRREATLAESPQVSLTLSPRSNVDVFLNVTYSDSMGTASSYGSSFSATSTRGQAYSASIWASTKVSEEVSLSETLGAKIGCCSLTAGASASATVGAEVTATIGGGVSTSYDYSTEQSFTSESNRASTQSLGRSVMSSSGTIRAQFELTNTSRIAFTVESPTIIVSRASGGLYTPIGSLAPTQTTTTRWTLAPGESASITMANTSLPADTIKAFLAHPSSLVFAPGPLNLLSAGEQNFAFVEATAQTNTARFVYRALTGAPVVGRVATNVGRDEHGALAGVPLRAVLKKLDVPFEESTIDGGVAVTIGGRGPVLYAGPPPSLDDPPYTQTHGPGPRVVQSQWFPIVFRLSTTRPPDVDNVLDARLFHGDTFVLAYVADHDRDGLNSAQEEALGSSDDLVDSDRGALADGGIASDGMSDFWEAKEGWSVRTTLDGALTDERHVFSSPRSLDSDSDGLTDDVERALATDPASSDTDRDGFDDAFEVRGGADGGAGTDAGVLAVDRTPPTLIVASQRLAPSPTNANDDVLTLNVQVADVAGDVVRMRFDWGDGSTDECGPEVGSTCRVPPTSRFFTTVSLAHTFIVDTPRTVTVQATDRFGDTSTVTSTFVPSTAAGAWSLSLPEPYTLPGSACVGNPGAASLNLMNLNWTLNLTAGLDDARLSGKPADPAGGAGYMGPYLASADTGGLGANFTVPFIDTRRNLVIGGESRLWQYFPNPGHPYQPLRFPAPSDFEVRCHFEALGQTSTTPVCTVHMRVSYWGICNGQGFYDVTVPLTVTR